MGEKPNQQDETGRESSAPSVSERGAGAVADVDQDGMADKKAGPRASDGESKTEALDDWSAQRRGNAPETNPPRLGQEGGNGDPIETSNLNLSKAGINREAEEAGGGEGEPADSINLNSSRSNIYREAGDGGEGPAPEDHVYQHNQTDLDFKSRE